MCGRFGLDMPRRKAVEYFGLAEADELEPRMNIAPASWIAAVFLDQTGARVLRHVRWGLVPSWARDEKSGAKMFNARSETVADKPSFRDSFATRRCVIPASRFYEWETLDTGGKQPYGFSLRTGAPLALAGIWDQWTNPHTGEVVPTCAILTCSPNPLIAPVHNRMPVILPPEQLTAWMSVQTKMDVVHQLLVPLDAELMHKEPVHL